MALKFLKKGAKKFYKAARKFAKKVDNPLVLAGLTFFAAGVGVAGFSAFKGAEGMTGFLGAVGKTTAAGAQGIMGAMGFTGGVSSGVAEGLTARGSTDSLSPGATLFGGNTGAYDLENSNIVRDVTTGMSRTAGASTAGAGAGAGQMGLMGGGGGGKALLLSGVISGIQSYQQNKQYKKERKRIKNLNFFGGPAIGGESELGIDMPIFSQSMTDPTGSTQEFMDEVNNPSPLFRGIG